MVEVQSRHRTTPAEGADFPEKDQHWDAGEMHQDLVWLRFTMTDQAQEEHKATWAGFKVESSVLTRYYCQDAAGKYASIKGVGSFLFFFFPLLVRYHCQIRFTSPSLLSFILHNSSSGDPSFVPRNLSRSLPRSSCLHNKCRQLQEQQRVAARRSHDFLLNN